MDAALVMRHSIHQTSSRVGASLYDYKIYALIHPDAVPCSSVLKDAGFELIVKPRPVEVSEIRGSDLRRTIHKEWCCGHDEFIKLYAYNSIPEPIVIHVDIDFIFHQPMDHVLDALLYHKDSPIGQAARRRMERERPTDPWPDEPQAVLTRDWPQVYPGRIPGYQAGFIALRPNPRVFDELVEIIKEGQYSEGNHRENGWGDKGYGGYVGARAMQGLIAYYYDQWAPDTWVELNQCRYNHMGVVVTFSPGTFGFRAGHPRAGKCRNGRDVCEDCPTTNVSSIYNIHYTQCKKPWNCIGTGDSTLGAVSRQKVPKHVRNKLIPEGLVHLHHCLELMQVWHSIRTDLEVQLHHEWIGRHHDTNQTNGTHELAQGQRGTYKTNVFQGHCASNGDYLTLANGHAPTLKLIAELYKPKEQKNGL